MNLDKWKQLEKIKLSYLKHRGNTLEVAEELNLPLDYIKKVVDKLKKQEDRNVSILISNTLMSHILLGSQSRTTLLSEMLRSLTNTEKPILSVCCSGPVRVVDGESLVTHVCLKCMTPCSITNVPKASIYNIKKDIIEQLREEDKTLIEMAEKMGYTNKEEVPTGPVFKQNILVVGNGVTPDPKIVQDIKQLPPMEREKLLERLKREMIAIDGQSEPNSPQSSI